jgi:hypothetical protein
MDMKLLRLKILALSPENTTLQPQVLGIHDPQEPAANWAEFKKSPIRGLTIALRSHSGQD